MIRLTLYKGCRLNDSYKNVISQFKSTPSARSPLEDYLVTKSPKIIELDSVYQEDNTIFNFTLTDNDYSSIYEYNYMKIESFIDNTLQLTRYAFINSIRICNDIGVIDYKLDIWHSFSQNIIGLNKSYLKGLRVVNGRGGIVVPSFYNLPVDYEGNNTITTPIKMTPGTNDQDCIIIVEIQNYDTAKYGDANYSHCQYYFITHTFNATKHSGENYYDITSTTHIKFKDVHGIIESMLRYKTKKTFGIVALGNTMQAMLFDEYFDIGNIYVIKNYSAIADKIKAVGNGLAEPYQDEIMNGIFFGNLNTVNNNSVFELISQTLPNNFKIRTIGTFSSQIPVIPNGTSIPIKLFMEYSSMSCKIYLNVMNKMLDVTDDFKIDVPLSAINGDVLAQQKISRALQNKNNDINLIGNIMSGTNGFASAFGMYGRGNANYNKSMLQNDMDFTMDRVSEGAISSSNILGIATGITGMVSGGVGMGVQAVNFGLSLASYVAKRQQINAPVFNSYTLVSANSIGTINAIYAFCYTTVSSDNDNYVKEVINNIGYNVYEYIDDISKIGLNVNPSVMSEIHYNCIQFAVADVYGNFPLNIKKTLDLILMNGIKFWYYPNFSDDTYAVG